VSAERELSVSSEPPLRPEPAGPWRPYPLAGTGSAGQVILQASTLGPERDLLVALPPGYEGDEARFPVIYLHDGQNLFDPATSFAGSWELPDQLPGLAASGTRAIVVGIPNRGRRRRYDYSPFRDRRHGGGGGDRYLDFVTQSVKPRIDAWFRTSPARADTVIGGSSLGGLISLYALYRYPGVFGAAAVQSPSLWFARRAIFRFLADQGGGPRGRIHLDVGLGEGERTVREVRELRQLLLDAGYLPGRDLSYAEELGAGHEEAAWGRRFAVALPFLLGGARGSAPAPAP
jgi:predicted alpha/beta superfamily hydrolase